ncbi:hypothetical protein LguiB_008609 [Lonicera macranthoides]
MPQNLVHTTITPPILNTADQNHSQSHSQKALHTAQSIGKLKNNKKTQKTIMPNQNCSSEPSYSDLQVSSAKHHINALLSVLACSSSPAVPSPSEQFCCSVWFQFRFQMLFRFSSAALSILGLL